MLSRDSLDRLKASTHNQELPSTNSIPPGTVHTLEPNARTSHTNPLTNQTRPIMSPLQGAHMETQVAITTLTTMIQNWPNSAMPTSISKFP